MRRSRLRRSVVCWLVLLPLVVLYLRYARKTGRGPL